MSGPRPQRSPYHQKALQQIRNSLQPFATPESGSTSSGISSIGAPNPPSPNRQSPSHHQARGIEYRAQQYPFVPSQVPASVQQLLRRIDSPSSPSSSSSNSPTSQLQPVIKKPTLVIRSTIVPKPVLQTAMPYSLPPPPPYLNNPPPLPPKPAKKSEHPLRNGDIEKEKLKYDSRHNNHNHITKELKSDPRIEKSHSPDVKMYTNNGNQTNGIQTNGNQINGNGDCRHDGCNNIIGIKDSNYSPHGIRNGNGEGSEYFNSDQSDVSYTPSETNDKPEGQSKEGSSETNETSNKLETNVNGEIHIHTHESPIPERKFWSREREEERYESKVRVYSPQAFKFFMEQHVENVIKSHQERLHRRMQLESEMTKIGLSEEAQTQMRRMLSQKESNYIRLKRAKMDKSLFKQIRTIGVGAFGEVALVRKLDTQHLYAMKTLRKSDVLRRNQVAHVKAERDILAEADNEWVVKLYYSFQDLDHLYFVMDYIPGGDLMSLLIKKGIFEENLAQFYIAELTCAVESVHKMGFIHRDIKPDNILIDRDGHIKLTDFGLCTGFRWTHNSKYYQDSSACNCDDAIKWQICACEARDKPLDRRRKANVRCLAHSLVGTPNYIAPEVLMRTGYTQLCDWWSVGVILYEMLVGQPPFLAPTPAETQYKVINWVSSLRIPSQASLSANAKDLILRLCTDHSRRLGKGGANQVKSHAFFTPVDFESGLRRTVAPFIPNIRHPTDTSNFDPCDGDKPDDTDSSPFDSNQFHGFFEFTFRRFFDDAYNEDGGPVYV